MNPPNTNENEKGRRGQLNENNRLHVCKRVVLVLFIEAGCVFFGVRVLLCCLTNMSSAQSHYVIIAVHNNSRMANGYGDAPARQ